MDTIEATVRIIEAMLASPQCPPPFSAGRGQTMQRETIRQEHAQMDTYRQDFVVLFRAIHDSVIEANKEATEPQTMEARSPLNVVAR